MTAAIVEFQIVLNQIVQGVIAAKDAVVWFLSLADELKRTALRELAAMTLQAGAVPADVEEAVSRSGSKGTCTPAVLLSKGPLKVQVARVIGLPAQEMERSFRLLVSLVAIADERRRATRCDLGCEHWWHQDLSDPRIVDQIRREYLEARPPTIE